MMRKPVVQEGPRGAVPQLASPRQGVLTFFEICLRYHFSNCLKPISGAHLHLNLLQTFVAHTTCSTGGGEVGTSRACRLSQRTSVGHMPYAAPYSLSSPR